MLFLRRVYASEVAKYHNKKVFVQGWVQETRDFGGIRFIILKDRSGYTQITLPKKAVPEDIYNVVENLTKESVVYVWGVAKKSNKAKVGSEIIPQKIEVVSLAEAPTPIDTSGKIKTDLAKRLDHRFLDVRNKKSIALFTIRSKMFKACVEYFDSNGFININTPKITSIGVESGAELFEVKYFERKAYLAQSPQVYKQMFVAAGFERVYEIAPVYRAEKSHTAQHLTEFIGVDFEQGFIESEQDVMDTVEGLIKHILKRVKEECKEELKLWDREVKIPKKIPRITMRKAKEILAEKGLRLPEEEDLNLEAQKILADYFMEKEGTELVFVYYYPWAVRPFYHMKPADDPSATKSFDLLWNGIEVATGAQREHRYEILKKQAEEKGINFDSMKVYGEIFRYGCPPHGGTGLGLDRLLEAFMKLPNIREGILLPRDPERLTP